MYGDRKSIANAKEKLNAVSPSFCVAKWLNATIHLHLGRTHSCHLPPHHPISPKDIKKDPSGIHNTAEKKSQRKLMLKGKRPAGCQSCWNIEDLPGEHYSDRHFMAHYFWAEPHFDEVIEHGHKKSINPRYLEVSFSSSCNFKCSYCSPTYSSSWEKEVKKFGAYKLDSTSLYLEPNILKLRKEMPLPEEDNPYIEAFWKWWPNLSPDLKVFRITGGEPLLSKDTFKIFDEIKKKPLPQLEFSINTNLGIPQPTFNKYIEHIKELLEKKYIARYMMYTSVDSYGPQAEYIRNGLDFNLFKTRVESYLQSHPKAHLSFMCTFNALSIFNFKEFLKWILELRKLYGKGRNLFIDTPYLRYPQFMTVQILPQKYHHYLEDIIRFMREYEGKEAGFRSGEVIKMERIFSWMKEAKPEEQIKHQKDFKRFFLEHDKRRDTNFLETFPELEEFWNSIETDY